MNVISLKHYRDAVTPHVEVSLQLVISVFEGLLNIVLFLKWTCFVTHTLSVGREHLVNNSEQRPSS